MEIFELDQAISILMTTGNDGNQPPPDPEVMGKTTDRNKIFPGSKDPFGGSTPEYER